MSYKKNYHRIRLNIPRNENIGCDELGEVSNSAKTSYTTPTL